MNKIPLLVLMVGVAVQAFSQNPHDADLRINCAACHSPDGWEIPTSAWEAGTLVSPNTEEVFSHDQTNFPLQNRHAEVDCRSCHATLEFTIAQNTCISCHTDLHQMTVGDDCTRCHSTEHWLVDDINEIHLENGFPMLGNHALALCTDCHFSETALRFDRIGNDCINCHLPDYEATTTPDHRAAGFPTECLDCHDMASPNWQWSAGGSGHLFFPLTEGHAINDCSACHQNSDFSNTPTDCFACHENDFRATTSPDHESGNFPMDCAICHTTAVGWPASAFTQHDEIYFPIFSGKHKGEWNECTDCHTVAGDFSSFSCIDCHEHNNANSLADEHDEVSNYSYSSKACYDCHPRGEE